MSHPPEEGALCGPALARFIQERCADRRELSDSQQRAVQRWPYQRQVRPRTAERILRDLGLDLRDVPPDYWQPYDNGRTGWRKDAA
jgi:hypothetical protein